LEGNFLMKSEKDGAEGGKIHDMGSHADQDCARQMAGLCHQSVGGLDEFLGVAFAPILDQQTGATKPAADGVCDAVNVGEDSVQPFGEF